MKMLVKKNFLNHILLLAKFEVHQWLIKREVIEILCIFFFIVGFYIEINEYLTTFNEVK